MDNIQLVPVKTEDQIRLTASLAETIWHQHFTPIIGSEQVEYMLEHFQSFDAVSAQIENGYQYFLIVYEGETVGYSGIKIDDNALFLSKIYILKDYRGKKISSYVMNYYTALCKSQGLDRIWLTCNKHNAGSLAAYDRMGFEVTDEQAADIGGGYVMDDFILTKYIN